MPLRRDTGLPGALLSDEEIPDVSTPDALTTPATQLAHARYEEGGWVAEVIIRRDLCDATREAYHLEVVETLAPPPPGLRPPRAGSCFHCDQPRDPAGLIFTLTRL